MICILDLDGTLVDSTKRHFVLMDRLLKKTKYYSGFDKESFMAYKAMGKSGLEYLTNVLKISNSEAGCIMRDWANHIEDEIYIDTDELYADTNFFLEALTKKGYRIAYLTKRQSADVAEAELRRLGLDRYSDELYVVGKTHAYKVKDDIITFLKKEDDVIIIGDTETEADAAIRTNTCCYILNRGFRSKKYWDRRKIETYSNLYQILEEIKEDK